MGISDYVKKGMEKADELADTLKEKAEDAVDHAGELAGALKEKAGDAFGRDTYLAKAQDMYAMCSDGKTPEAFEKYYADNVVMVEATGDTTEGKAANRARIQAWMESVAEMHNFSCTAITADEKAQVTMAECRVDATFKSGDQMQLEQVAVQRWEDDHIVHERFYYNIPTA